VLAVALGLASSLSWGVSDFLGGVVSRRLSVLAVLAVSQPVGLGLALIVALAFGESLPAWAWAVAAAGGACGALGLGAFYRAMAIGTVSVVTPVASLGVVVPVAVGLARGESPATVQIAGLAVAGIGIMLASREAELRGWSTSPQSLLLAGLAGLGFGTFFVALDVAADHDAPWTLVAGRTGGVAVVLLAWAAADRPSPAGQGALAALLAMGFLDVLANGLYAVATTEGLLSLVAVAGSLYPVVTVILARFVLGERLARLQRAGVALALFGVVMIAAGV
jgi:drug/metabolite transporter (DMT)-like permease